MPEDGDGIDHVEPTDPIFELADEVLGSGLVAIEITVDFDLWHFPIQQLNTMSIQHI